MPHSNDHQPNPSPPEELTLDRATLEKLLAHATSVARIVGHSDALAAGPIADHVDAIVHELSELLGNHHLLAAPVPSVRPSYDDDEYTQARSCSALPPRKQLAEGAQ
jgi:hypothetical protein